jgi:hypothetical protein
VVCIGLKALVQNELVRGAEGVERKWEGCQLIWICMRECVGREMKAAQGRAEDEWMDG